MIFTINQSRKTICHRNWNLVILRLSQSSKVCFAACLIPPVEFWIVQHIWPSVSTPLSWCFFSEDGKIDSRSRWRLATIKSISWSNCSLVRVSVPAIIIWPVKAKNIQPLSPSMIGSRLQYLTWMRPRGKVILFHNKYFKPLASVKVSCLRF